jgi:hypothetical protein
VRSLDFLFQLVNTQQYCIEKILFQNKGISIYTDSFIFIMPNFICKY